MAPIAIRRPLAFQLGVQSAAEVLGRGLAFQREQDRTVLAGMGDYPDRWRCPCRWLARLRPAGRRARRHRDLRPRRPCGHSLPRPFRPRGSGSSHRCVRRRPARSPRRERQRWRPAPRRHRRHRPEPPPCRARRRLRRRASTRLRPCDRNAGRPDRPPAPPLLWVGAVAAKSSTPSSSTSPTTRATHPY